MFKTILVPIIKIFHLFLLVIVMMEIMGCEPVVGRDEITRISSPDFIVDAVLIRTNAGATTSFGFEIYIVRTGDIPTEADLLFRGDKMEGLKLRWVQSKLLTIQYEQGQIFHFSNFWSSRDIQYFKYEVEVLLIKKL